MSTTILDDLKALDSDLSAIDTERAVYVKELLVLEDQTNKIKRKLIKFYKNRVRKLTDTTTAYKTRKVSLDMKNRVVNVLTNASEPLTCMEISNAANEGKTRAYSEDTARLALSILRKEGVVNKTKKEKSPHRRGTTPFVWSLVEEGATENPEQD